MLWLPFNCGVIVASLAKHHPFVPIRVLSYSKTKIKESEKVYPHEVVHASSKRYRRWAVVVTV